MYIAGLSDDSQPGFELQIIGLLNQLTEAVTNYSTAPTKIYALSHLRCHPVGGAHETVGWTSNTRGSEIRQFDVAGISQQDVSCLDIPDEIYQIKL